MTGHIVIIGAGIVGVSAGIWLRRFGAEVTIVDRGPPGQGTSYGNAGVLASCAMVPVTVPELLRKAPGYLANPDFPLFLRWRYMPKLAPWLVRYLGHANDADTRRIARDLTPIIGDSVDQHKALTQRTGLEHWVTDSDYQFAYASRAAFDADAYTWALRRENGFEPVVLEGPQVQEKEPGLSPEIRCLAVLGAHGFIRDPGGYVAALADLFTEMGGSLRQTEAEDFDLSGGRIRAVQTAQGSIPCDSAIITAGVWSRPLMQKLGLSVPLESERGYHIVFERAENGPKSPTMVASGKFVATPMAAGLRCAGVVEFGGLTAGPSKAPFALLRRQTRAAFPGLTFLREEEWMGHRPAPADSLPLIGQIRDSGVFTGFGHHHVGLTGGPKTGRLIAEMMTGRVPNTDMAPYSPTRFASA
jgi:D-amino-acid dehydrogenase